MSKTTVILLAALIAVAMLLETSTAPRALGQPPGALRVASEHTVSGVPFPESVGYDAQGKVLYVSQFVSALKPTEKDGKGRISRVSLTGEILDAQFLPAGGDVLNKPKGIWIQGDRLWVTDIDVVWVFDLKTRKGRKLALPDAKFANDPAVMANVLYVSDNVVDAVYRVEPSDFLDAKSEPKVTRVFSGKSVNPNGVYPGRDGSLLMAGFASPDQARAIYALSPGGEVKPISKELGRLDGLYQVDDGTLLVTDWKSGSLIRWSPSGEVQTLASGFKGPADFAVAPESGGLLVVVPDLVKSELRLIHLAR